MTYEESGELTTDKRTVGKTEEWATQTDWEAYQLVNNIDITNGVLMLSESSLEPPDSQDLHARYSALDDDRSLGAITNISDLANSFDLSGNAELIDSGINNNRSYRFDGVDDAMQVAFSALSQPNHVFVVYQYRSANQSGTQVAFDSADSTNRNVLYEGSGGVLNTFAGSNLEVKSPNDTQEAIGSFLYNGASSVNRINGAQVASGDLGSDGLSGLTLGAENDQSNNSPVDIGEVLVYPQDKSGIVGDVENYLNDKWGVF